MIKNLLIIGCGLIGSSILRAVHRNNIAKKIFIYEKSKKNISEIKKLKISSIFVKDIKKNISLIDMIIFCTPMSEYKRIISRIDNFVNPNCILTDVGSTKEKFHSNTLNKFKIRNLWVSGHPIAGSEVSGPEYGKSNLFKNKWCILIKDKNTDKKKIAFLARFWRKLGSNISVMDPKKHDTVFSMTSHLPHLIAYNLVNTATDFEKQKKYKIINFSAGGLRDFSRIAASNEIMWRDIFFSNKKNISISIDLFVRNLKILKKIINFEKDKLIIGKLTKAKKVRKKIIKLKQDINKPNFGRD